MSQDPIVEKLKAEQDRAGMSTRAFARHLEIDPTLWSRIRRGERGMGREVLERALRRYPKLRDLFAEPVTVGTT